MSLRIILSGCLSLTLLAYGAGSEPSSDQVVSRILFGSCIQQDRPAPVFKAMLEVEPDLMIFLGDNIYADTADMEVMRLKYETLAGLDGFAKLRQACRVLATWDDHDYGANDSGAEYAERGASQRLFLDFWRVPSDSPRRAREGVYHAEIFGPIGRRVQVILLDTRYFRSPLAKGDRRDGGPYVPDPDPTKTMLGEAQWGWLEEQLQMPAELRIIASSIQFIAEASGQETWSNLPHERERFVDLIRRTGAEGVLLISGDRHWAEISALDDVLDYPLVDVTSSSLNQRHPRGTPTENRYRIVQPTYHDVNFGLVSIDWDSPGTPISMEIRDVDGSVRIEKQLSLDRLRSQSR